MTAYMRGTLAERDWRKSEGRKTFPVNIYFMNQKNDNGVYLITLLKTLFSEPATDRLIQSTAL